MTTANSFDFALRVCESIAFGLHSILGMTEPWTGCLRAAFRDKGAMPKWFWPCAGAMLAIIAVANFYPKENSIVLAVQGYIAVFHFGACFYHLRLGHDVVVAVVPLVFVFMALVVVVIRTSIFVALVGAVPCAAIAALGVRILVSQPRENGEDDRLLEH